MVKGLRTSLDLISVENEVVVNGRGIHIPCRLHLLSYNCSGRSFFLSVQNI